MTFYGSIRDYRLDQQNPTGAPRAHAICRKLVGTYSQESPWYGVHYWAACGVLGNGKGQDYDYGLGCWLRECEGTYKFQVSFALRLYRKVYLRILSIRESAIALKTSVLW